MLSLVHNLQLRAHGVEHELIKNDSKVKKKKTRSTCFSKNSRKLTAQSFLVVLIATLKFSNDS